MANVVRSRLGGFCAERWMSISVLQFTSLVASPEDEDFGPRGWPRDVRYAGATPGEFTAASADLSPILRRFLLMNSCGLAVRGAATTNPWSASVPPYLMLRSMRRRRGTCPADVADAGGRPRQRHPRCPAVDANLRRRRRRTSAHRRLETVDFPAPAGPTMRRSLLPATSGSVDPTIGSS